MNILKRYARRVAAAVALLPLLCACDEGERPAEPEVATSAPEGMVEIRPVLGGAFSAIPRVASRGAESRAYDPNDVTGGKLGNRHRLPQGSTVWLIAKKTATAEGMAAEYERRSYVVYNPVDATGMMSYLVPCEVDEKGDVVSMSGAPLYLKSGEKYMFYAISPARELDEAMLAKGKIGFKVKNGEAFYAHDCRYTATTPEEITVEINQQKHEAVCKVDVCPMINQTAELRFQIRKGYGVHDLGIQPSGVQVSGLQEDSPDGLPWHMSEATDDEPFELRRSGKSGVVNDYEYTVDENGMVNVDVPVLPMYGFSTPVIVVFRLKINGVPTSYEMMLNEKDFKAGYTYGYRGEVSILEGVDVITWQFVGWEYDLPFPFD